MRNKENKKILFNFLVFLLGLGFVYASIKMIDSVYYPELPATAKLRVILLKRIISAILHPASALQGNKTRIWFIVFLAVCIVSIICFFIRKTVKVCAAEFFRLYICGLIFPRCLYFGLSFLVLIYDFFDYALQGKHLQELMFLVVHEGRKVIYGTSILTIFLCGLFMLPAKWGKIRKEIDSREKSQPGEKLAEIRKSRQVIWIRAGILAIFIFPLAVLVFFLRVPLLLSTQFFYGLQMKEYYYALQNTLILAAAIFTLITLYNQRFIESVLTVIKHKSRKERGKSLLIVLLILALAFIVFRVIIPWTGENTHPTRSKLYVNGNPVEDKNVIIYNHGDTYCAELPLLAVVESLGYRVFVESDDLVFFEIGANKYRLTDKSTLSTDNGDIVCRVHSIDITSFGREGPLGEIYMEYEDLVQVLSNVGIPSVEVTIDPQNKTVFLEVPQLQDPD